MIYLSKIILCVLTVVTDPEETLPLNHTVGPGYTLTLYVSLPRQDPLLLGSITEFRFTVFVIPEGGRPSIYDFTVVNTTENTVCNLGNYYVSIVFLLCCKYSQAMILLLCGMHIYIM